MIPNVIGMTKKDAKRELKGLKVEFVGDGNKVIDTSPQVNTRAKEAQLKRNVKQINISFFY